jgi:hypothetical protein
MELMNPGRRRKRIAKDSAQVCSIPCMLEQAPPIAHIPLTPPLAVVAQAGQRAAEAAVSGKRIKLVESDDRPATKTGRNAPSGGMMAVDETGDSDDANADLIMGFTKAEKAQRQAAAKKAAREHHAEATEVKMSKTKQKALQRLKERQEREAKRGELFASLAQHAIDAREIQLLKSSSKLGAGQNPP